MNDDGDKLDLEKELDHRLKTPIGQTKIVSSKYIEDNLRKNIESQLTIINDYFKKPTSEKKEKNLEGISNPSPTIWSRLSSSFNKPQPPATIPEIKKATPLSNPNIAAESNKSKNSILSWFESKTKPTGTEMKKINFFTQSSSSRSIK